MHEDKGERLTRQSQAGLHNVANMGYCGVRSQLRHGARPQPVAAGVHQANQEQHGEQESFRFLEVKQSHMIVQQLPQPTSASHA